ncbi:hypothetical protein [uncultured Gimesia sp.]|uniref:hypothetical protein n=1 Tax=uncultured Gimesia sp. TaxID=1678688 RepID=UPI00262263EB|nr:hypothetical protein [uncultured Gimesia sp.]
MARRLPGLLSISGFFLSATTTVMAQGEEQSGLVSESQTSIFEYILVAVLFGLALFAICRTSHRS